MKGAWAIRLAHENAGALVALRLVPGVEVFVSDSTVWARCHHLDSALDALLRGIPLLARYAWREENVLVEEGRRIPTNGLPAGPWIPIQQWISPQLPAAHCAAALPTACPISLQRTTVESPPNLLLCTLEDWYHYASRVSEIRLAHLTFASNNLGQTLIRGNPLPPLPGQRWTEVDGVAIPLGYTWQPAVSSATLARAWGASAYQLVLWHADGRAEWVYSEQFIPASRLNASTSYLAPATQP